MSKRLSVLVVTLLLLLAYRGVAQATYYHFENNRLDDIQFVPYDPAPAGFYKVFTWTFDLDADTMDLWEIPAVPLNSYGTNWYATPHTVGSMSSADELHQAYLTMRFTQVKDAGDVEQVEFIIPADEADSTTWYLTQGGLLNQDVYFPNLHGGALDVLSYLKDDHELSVTLTALSGSFIVDYMNLAGCYQAYAVVPEPGTLLLLGGGLVGMILLLRRKSSGETD